MIEMITFETAHLLGDVLPAMLRLRYRVFVEREGYSVPTFREMEWDQFDNPAAVYLIWRDERGAPRAMARLIPTTFPYMIKELWPEMIEAGPLPSDPDTWELTRSGVDRGIDPNVRETIIGEMLCGLHEFALENGIRNYVQVTHPRVAEYTMRRAGCAIEYLGRPRRIARFPVVASRLVVRRRHLLDVRAHFRLTRPVLRVVGDNLSKAA